MAEWKQHINDEWQELMELIGTRMQLLKTSFALHKFFTDCVDLIDQINVRRQQYHCTRTLYSNIRICKAVVKARMFVCLSQEKLISIPEEYGKDYKTVTTLQRNHVVFERELALLRAAVEQATRDSDELLPRYSDLKEREIRDRRAALEAAWKQLEEACLARRIRLFDASDLYRFLNMARELRAWIADVMREMGFGAAGGVSHSGVIGWGFGGGTHCPSHPPIARARESMSRVTCAAAEDRRPRDVSGVKLLQSQHESLKAEIDAHDEHFFIVVRVCDRPCC